MTYENVLANVDKLRNVRQWLKYQFKIEDKQLLKKNKELKGVLGGKRVFVLGNSPSLKKQDLSLLRGEIVLTVNQIARNPDFFKFDTTVHFWADVGFFDFDNVSKDLLETMKSVRTKANNPKVFYPLAAKSFVEAFNLDKALDVYYFAPVYFFHEGYHREIDFCKGVPGFFTVVQNAISLAIYMGASEIYLLGCDCTGIISYISTIEENTKAAYAYDILNVEKQRMKTMLSKTKTELQFLGYYKIFNHYSVLCDYCKKRNIKLVNCTGGGILRELPREQFEDVIAQKA